MVWSFETQFQGQLGAQHGQLGAQGIDFVGLGGLWGGFRKLPGLICRGSFAQSSDIARTTSILEKPLKTSTGAIKFKVRTLTPYAKINRKNAKNRARGLSRKPCHKKLYKKLVPGSPARFSGVLEPSRRLLGTSWALPWMSPPFILGMVIFIDAWLGEVL